jgi:hypothetical protein
MASHGLIKETIMPNNQEYKGKGDKATQGKPRRKQGNQQDSDLASGPGENAQRSDQGSQQSGNLGQGRQSQSDLGSGPGDNSLGGSRQSGNLQSGGQGSRSGRSRLDQDDLDLDDTL